MSKKYYRPEHSRNLYAVERDGNEWSVSYIQIGQAEDATKCLEQALGLVSFLELPQPEMPGKPFEISCYTGYSGCRQYYIETPPKKWYDIIPGTTFIRECTGKTKRQDLLYVSMYGKINSLNFKWN